MPSNPKLLVWVELRTERRLESFHLSLRWAVTGRGLGGVGCPVGGSDAHLRNSIPSCS